MKNNERTIQFFDIDLSGQTTAKDIKGTLSSPKTLDELMVDFISLHDTNLARKEVSAGSRLEFRLEDIENRNDCWVLLINIVDTNAAYPVIHKIGGVPQDRKVISLNDGLGLETSSHLIIFKQQNQAKKHLALIERNPHLPVGKAKSFLNKLCKKARREYSESYEFPHPSCVKNKKISKYCVVDFLAHPSTEFIDEISGGKINSIKITSDMDLVKGYDSNKHPELIGTEIKMNVRYIDIKRSGGNWKHVQKAIKYADSLNSPYVRVSFLDHTGAGHTAKLSSDTGNLYDADKYVKKCKIVDFNDALSSSFTKINADIRDKMLELL